MPLYRPSELQKFLKTLQASPNKKLSQNFLIDGNIIKKIINSSFVQEGDRILEIGPGPGALTEALVQENAHVVAIEKDIHFSEMLDRFPNVIVYRSDIMDFPLDSLKGEYKMKVVANLPYHLTSPILGLLLPRHDLFSQVTVMVQEEVARRIVAKEKTKDYSALSVFVNTYSEASYEFFVSRNCFYPRPKVDSAVVSFVLKPPPISNIQPYLDFVKLLFCHRRKMIRGILSSQYSKSELEKGLAHISVPLTVRPEELSPLKLIDFFLKLESNVGCI